MKRFFFRALPAGAVLLLTGWLLAAEPPPPPAQSVSQGGKQSAPALECCDCEDVDVQEFVFLAETRPLLVRLHVRVDGKPMTDAWNDFMKYLFAYLDANGDGTLSKEEAERMPNPDQLTIGGLALFAGGGKAPMDKLDTNKDGKVTLDELKAYCRSKNFTPFQFQLVLNPPDPLAQVGILGGYKPEPGIPVVSKAVFDRLDDNKDGRLTKEELEAAQAVLLRRDENEDEILTTQELTPDAKPAGGGMAAMAMRAVAGNSDSEGKQILIPIAVHGQAPPELARLMQKRYDPSKPAKDKAAPKAEPKPAPAPPPPPSDTPKEKQAAPKTEPKPAVKIKVTQKSEPEKGKKEEKKQEPERKLTRKQLGLDEVTFARLDADKDGALDSKEQAAFVQREPDLRLIVSFGTKSGKALDFADGASLSFFLAGTVRQQQDDLVLFDLGKTRMELRQNEQARRKNYFTDILRSQLTALFRAADKDGDGFVDEKEAKASPQFAQVRNNFKTLDRDGDGKLSEKEMLAYFDKMQEIQKRARAACVTLVLRDQSRGLFELLDTNRDGKLGLRELRQAPKVLERVSAQGRTYLSKDDMPRSYLMTVRRGPSQGGDLAAQEMVFDRLYGYSDDEEGPAGRGPSWFRKMDRNRDGDVSPKEFLFSEEMFRKIDADGDGLISLQEAEKAGD